MARSLVVLRSDKRKVKAQFRRVRERLQDSALKLEGPFGDVGGVLAKLSSAVTAKGSISDPLWGTLFNVGAQRTGGGRSSLKTPFIVGQPELDLDYDSAVSVARSSKTKVDGRDYRQVDMEALTLLSVAVLRMNGVPALFAYQHPDPSDPGIVAEAMRTSLESGASVGIQPVPCVLVMDDAPQTYLVAPPYYSGFPNEGFIAGIEILDDEALVAFMRIKMAYHRMLSLMTDVGSRTEEFDGEGSLRAYAIGHLLHEGRTAWTEESAKDSIEDAQVLLGKNAGFESVRSMAEKNAVHGIICPACHTKLAKDMIFTVEEKGMLRDIATAACQGDFESVERSLEELGQGKRLTKLLNYMQFAVQINEHVHPPDECERLNGSPGN